MDLFGKKALVCGMATSGISAAKLLRSKGAIVTLQDLKEEEKFDIDLNKIKSLGIDLFLGKNPDEIVGDFDLMVISPGLDLELSFIRKAMELGVEVIGEFELGARFCKAPILAITGTNGKTTTTALLGKIVASYHKDSQVVGNIGIAFTEKCENISENSICVAEVSSFQLESSPDFNPNVAAILNITPDHLDRHKTFENYANVKASIAKNHTSSDYLILNYDDNNCQRIAKTVKSRVIFFSSTNILEEGVYLKNGEYICLKLDGEEYDVAHIDELKVLGKHNHENVMAAVLMAYLAKIPLAHIRREIIDFGGVEHRIEYVTTINDIEFYNDSKGTNSDASEKSIEAMKRPIVLIGGGYDKNADFTDWIKKFRGRVKEFVILGEVKEKIARTCDDVGFKNYTLVDSFEVAVNLAYEKANSGDCVLLSPACASWDMFKSFEERGEIFKSLIYKLKK